MKEMTEALDGLKKDLEPVLTGQKAMNTRLAGIETDVKSATESLRKQLEAADAEIAANKKTLDDVRRSLLSRSQGQLIRPAGGVSNVVAKYLVANMVLASAKLDKRVDPRAFEWCRKFIIDEVGGHQDDPRFDGPQGLKSYGERMREASWEKRTALTTSDIPLPTEYEGQLVELVKEYGSFRRHATTYPMGAGDTKLPKLGTDPTFGLIAMSGTVTEKSPTISWVDFSAKKWGGTVRLPSEIDQDSLVAMGQFLARYIARQMANVEDRVGWLADGSGTYASLEGATDRVVDNSKVVTLTTGNTASEDIALADLRSARRLVNEAVLGMSAYYMNITMEGLLQGLTDDKNQKVYQFNGAQGATLDGFPVRWVSVLPANSATAAVSTVPVLFGDASYWYLGDRGAMRLDVSNEAGFETDEIMYRALKRFTVEEMATDHMAGVRLAAS